MAKRPESFKFYPSAFRDGVRRMKLEEVGAYCLLLCEQFETETLPCSHEELRIVMGCDEKTFKRVWRKLRGKFERTTDGYQNARLAEEREAAFKVWHKSTVKKPKPSDNGEAETTLVADIELVVKHYQWYHPKARPGDRDRVKVRARLKEGYGVGDILKAIDGCHVSPWHCGENDDGKKWQSLELIVRDSKHVTTFLEAWDQRGDKVMSVKERRGQRASQNLTNSVKGLFDDATE